MKTTEKPISNKGANYNRNPVVVRGNGEVVLAQEPDSGSKAGRIKKGFFEDKYDSRGSEQVDSEHLQSHLAEANEEEDDRKKQQDIAEGKADYEQDGQNGSRIGSVAVNGAVLPSEFSVARKPEIVFTSETGVRKGNHTAESIFPLENKSNNREDQMREEEIIAELKSVIQERSKLPKYRVGEPEGLYEKRSAFENKIDQLLDLLAEMYDLEDLDLDQPPQELPEIPSRRELTMNSAARSTLDDAKLEDDKSNKNYDLGTRIQNE